jgi:hypothetical protein
VGICSMRPSCSGVSTLLFRSEANPKWPAPVLTNRQTRSPTGYAKRARLRPESGRCRPFGPPW